MSGGRALVSGRVKSDLTAIVIESDALRRVIAVESDLGEKLLLSFILRRMRMVANKLSDVTLIAPLGSAAGDELATFLSRSAIPFQALDPASDAGAVAKHIDGRDVDLNQLPVALCNDNVLVCPNIRALAECLGFTAEIECGQSYDVAVIGSGPAGLASAVYAASEGLSVLVLEQCAVGGQAGSSSKIENYMGFPTGISGQALTGRGYLQAQKFGAQIAVARALEGIVSGTKEHTLHIDGGERIKARSVVVATGAIYRQPDIQGLDTLSGVHYGASHLEGQVCAQKDVAIIGGGNSAGQAAVYLSKRANEVHIFIRGTSLTASMSDYLIQRIDKISNIHVHAHEEIEAVKGKEQGAIEGISIRNNQTEVLREQNIQHLFVFIGAQPGTEFLKDSIALDKKGFVLTGESLSQTQLADFRWPLERAPHLFETSCPRVFAVGDVRSGSVKRVASAVGEGSVCVQFVHSVLGE